MPQPATISEFLEIAKKSGIVDESKLAAYLQQLREQGPLPKEPSKLAGLLLRDGLLTMFQAENLLQGRWKRFTIGKYKVLEKLGVGGMGQVYLCEHKVMKRRVAVKVLPVHKAEDPSSLERFYREARVVAALDHVNIVRAYDIDEDDSGGTTLHFLVMEYVDGRDFQELVKKFGPMDPLRACHYMRQSAMGLQHAFDVAGIIHRDIKPGNILIDRQGVVKILDMGLARFFHDEEDLLTKQYDETVLGTADYLAPEQAIDSHNVDIRADIYSLGATFYFLLTGQPPFPEGTVAQKLVWHGTKQPTSIRTLRPEVPAEIVAIVEKMMAKEKDARYQKPEAVAEALTPLTTTPIPPPPEAEMPRLSLAAMGGSGPATMASPTRVSSGPPSPPPAPRAPTTPAPMTPSPRTPDPRPAPKAPLPFDTSFGEARPAPPPVLPPTQAARRPEVETAEAPQIWAAIAAETPAPTGTSSGTQKNRALPKAPSGRVRTVESPAKSTRRRWLIIGAAVIALVVLTLVLLFVAGVFGGGNETVTNNAPTGPQRLVVDTSATPEPNSFKLVALALGKARAGDTIVVRGPALEESEWLNVASNKFPANVTIEAENAPMPWRLPASTRETKSVLTLANMDGLKFKGFAFDGQGKADNGIHIQSRCPGVTFENCQVSNCKVSAVKLSNAAGEEGRPITFAKMRLAGTSTTKDLIHLVAAPNVETIKANQHIAFKECRIDGSAGALIVVEGSANGVLLSQCLIANGADGIVFRPQKGTQWSGLTIQGNTFAHISRDAIQLGPAENAFIEGDSFALRENQFASCKSVFTVVGSKPMTGLVMEGNVRDSSSGEGNGGLGAKVGEVKVPNQK